MLGTPVSASSVKHIAVLAAAVLVAASFVVVPRPAATGPVADALRSASSSDKGKVRSLYSALADVTSRDSGRLISTTAAWRAIHADALRLAVGGTDLVGKYPGLDRAVDDVLQKYVPLDQASLSSKDKDGVTIAERIVHGCRAVEAQSE